jgi:pimeloyl-ACP methyl ester carboxylesterase
LIELPQKRVRLASGIELDTVDMGPPDAPALIFLHGFPESHRTWRHQIARFSDRFRCIAPDQRGYRGSSKPQDPAEYTGEKLVGDVFHLADALDIGEFTIVGHDWGGAVAWGVALTGQLTGRVRRAVIANAPHPAVFQKLLWTDPHQRAASQYVRAFRDPSHDDLIREHGLAALLLKIVRWERPAALEPAERDDLFSGWRNPDAAFGMLNWYRASRFEVPEVDAPYEVPASRSAGFPAITIPTLVIWALEDIALPPANLDGLDELVEDLTVVRIPGCGHFVPWEAPDAVNQAMESFLAPAV